MLQANHKITIGGDRYSSPANSRLISLNHSARMDIPVNVCSITMSPPNRLKLKPDDDISIELGIGNSTKQVFKGKIARLDWGIDAVRIEAASAARSLVYARYNMYFEQSTAGSIVSDICREAGVDTGMVQPGLLYDYYAVGSNLNASSHLHNLAIQSGYDTYTDEADRRIFSMFVVTNVHILQYAVNILNIVIEEAGEGIGKTEVYGESPASLGQGPLGATWFTKKEVSGTESRGKGESMPVFEPALRSSNLAVIVAKGYHAAFAPKKKGWVKTLGDPHIKPGDAVQVMLMPIGSQNGTYKVSGVEHSISQKQGFITKLKIEAI